MIYHDKENNANLTATLGQKAEVRVTAARPTVSETDYDKWVEAAVAPSRPLTEKKSEPASLPGSVGT